MCPEQVRNQSPTNPTDAPTPHFVRRKCTPGPKHGRCCKWYAHAGTTMHLCKVSGVRTKCNQLLITPRKEHKETRPIEESTLSLPHAWLSHATLQPPCLELTRAEPNTRTALNQSRSVTEREVLDPRPEIEDAKATYPAGGPKHFGPVVSMLPLRTGPEVTPLVKPAPGEKAGEP